MGTRDLTACPRAQAVQAPTCAVVVNWNGWRDTLVCLDSLFRQDAPLRVVVCDNGSADDSVAQVQAWLHSRCGGWQDAPGGGWQAPDAPRGHGVEAIHLLALGTNLGYAGALNAGILWSQAHWGSRSFWLLNNDVEARPDALRALQAARSRVPDAGICGSVLVDWDRPQEIQAVAGTFRHCLGVGDHLRAVPPGDVYLEAAYPVGASLYVEQDYLDRVGLMDDTYFLYCEEMDWAERGRRNGLRPVIALESRLRHKEGASTGSRGGVRCKSPMSEYYGVLNRLRITRKFWPAWLPVVWTSLWLVLADRLVHGEVRRAAIVLRLMFSPWAWLATASGRRFDPQA